MFQRPATTFACSLGILAAAVVVLYLPERLSTRSKGFAPAAGDKATSTARVEQAPTSAWSETPGRVWTAHNASAISNDRRQLVQSHRTEPRDESRARALPHPAPRVMTVSERSRQDPALKPRRPAASYTRVDVGESLADVAARVYGSPEFTAALWVANRDQLSREDQALVTGCLLRTPTIQP